MDSLFEDGIAFRAVGFEIPDLERVRGVLVCLKPETGGSGEDARPSERSGFQVKKFYFQNVARLRVISSLRVRVWNLDVN